MIVMMANTLHKLAKQPTNQEIINKQPIQYKQSKNNKQS